jgi:hypothetical protein
VQRSLRGGDTAAPAVPGRIRLHAPAEVVRGRVPASRVTVTADGDGCVLTTTGGWSRPFLVWTAMLGFELTVLDPPELVDEARALAGRLAAA